MGKCGRAQSAFLQQWLRARYSKLHDRTETDIGQPCLKSARDARAVRQASHRSASRYIQLNAGKPRSHEYQGRIHIQRFDPICLPFCNDLYSLFVRGLVEPHLQPLIFGYTPNLVTLYINTNRNALFVRPSRGWRCHSFLGRFCYQVHSCGHLFRIFLF